jgi:hypothetical protein
MAGSTLVLSDYANTQGSVVGTSVATTLAALSGASSTDNDSAQGVSLITGAPSDGASILSADSKIATAYGSSRVFFAQAELGAAHSTTGVATQTTTSTVEESVDLTRLGARNDLIVGLYNGASTGSASGFVSLTFDLYADNNDVIHQTFTTLSAAVAYFTNNAVDVGSLATGSLSGATLNLEATISVVTRAAGTGVYGDLIIGESGKAASVSANALSSNASVAKFAQMMASLPDSLGGLDLSGSMSHGALSSASWVAAGTGLDHQRPGASAGR